MEKKSLKKMIVELPSNKHVKEKSDVNYIVNFNDVKEEAVEIRIRGSEYELKLNRKETSSLSSMYSNTSFNSMKKIYKSSSDSNCSSPMLKRSTKQEENTEVPFVYIYVSPRCKQIFCSLWRIFLIVYAVVLPVLFVVVVKDTLSTLEKFDILQNEMNHHINISTHHVEQSKRERRNSRTRYNNSDSSMTESFQLAIKEFQRTYKILPNIEAQFKKKLEEIRERMDKLDSRILEKSKSKRLKNLRHRMENTCQCEDIKGEVNVKEELQKVEQKNRVDGLSNVTQPFVTYTHWGVAKCKNGHIYSGYTGVSPSNDPGGGSNYLCLTDQPRYNKHTKRKGSNTARIDATKYGKSFDKQNSNNYNKKLVDCSLCYDNGKTTSLMIPATTKCPNNWTVSFTGYLATESTNTRTEFICVDNTMTPESRRVNSRVQASVIETTSVEKCNILPCNSKSYISKKTLDCVVCIK